jgi:hypothetical protein
MSDPQARVLRALCRRGLTAGQIIDQFGILRPASVILYLRKRGHQIVTLRQPRSGMAMYVMVREAKHD